MTDYELLCKVVEYLNKVITSQNEVVEATEGLQDAFSELQTYVATYFENLDVQEEINNKLDEMAEAGTLQEIITAYIQANVAWTFDTVADMKMSENLVNGSYARTLGFHSLNDGGGAFYKITNSGTANEKDIIAIGNTLYANLIEPIKLNPEIYGAYGDNTHDDTAVLQYMFNKHKPCVLTKTYLTTETLNIGYSGISVDAKSSVINYTDNTYALTIQGLNGGNIDFGEIKALNGSCINISSTYYTSSSDTDRVIYLNLSFNLLRSLDRCINIYSSGTGYTNEIRIRGGELVSGDYGVYVDAYRGGNGLYFENLGFEGPACNYYIDAHSEETLQGIRMYNDRFIENQTSTHIHLLGNISRLTLDSWCRLNLTRFDTTGMTLLKEAKFNCPIYDSNDDYFADGMVYSNSGIRSFTYLDRYSPTVSVNSTLVTSGSIRTREVQGIVYMDFNGITTNAKSGNIVATGGVPAKIAPADNKDFVLASADGVCCKARVKTDGGISINGETDIIGVALYGTITYNPLKEPA